MDPIEKLEQINQAFAELLAAPRPAQLAPAHRADELMVWFLLGGKDVGKSTFLNSLLQTQVSSEPPESAEGTSGFVAYIHHSARPELEARISGLPLKVRFHDHQSEAHRRLCLIDSPDFDSRYQSHAAQVARALGAGAADGVVLLASPAKYKDVDYWNAFNSVSGAMSLRHILFVLTKADELGDYIDQVRDDFRATIERRVDAADQGNAGRIYLVDSIERGLDFKRLESKLLRKLSADDVAVAQRHNRQQALSRGANSIREHYRLPDIGGELARAMAPEQIDEAFEEQFSDVYFQAVSARLARHSGVAAAVREELWTLSGRSLAGVSAISGALRWISSRRPLRLRSKSSHDERPPEASDLAPLLRWGGETLEQRLERAQRRTLEPLRLEHPEALEPLLDQGAAFQDLEQLLDDHLAQPVKRLFSWPLRLLLNLPVYLYLLFFVCLLFYPALLMLRAWGLIAIPGFEGLLTLENVEVSVIGFIGYYIMAAMFVIRRSRERVRSESELLAQRFVEQMRELLRGQTRLPLQRFSEQFTRLLQRLDSAV
ncbi:MAG: GTPase domain-containing protein [Candidatus Alcyoniella australis]|nr:GTPase domain-containing protein [Candidatus Alcyoniella australis]